MNLKEAKRQILKAIVEGRPKEAIAGIDSLIAGIERLQAENKRLSEEVEDLKMDIGFLREGD